MNDSFASSFFLASIAEHPVKSRNEKFSKSEKQPAHDSEDPTLTNITSVKSHEDIQISAFEESSESCNDSGIQDMMNQIKEL